MKTTEVSTALVYETLSGVTYTTLQQIVDQLQEGSLNKDIAFADLKKYAEVQKKSPHFVIMFNNDGKSVGILQGGYPLSFEKYLFMISKADRIKLLNIMGSLNKTVLELDKFEKEILAKYNK